MLAQDLEPRWFCGGGWYIDAGVATAVGALGYVDVTATRFRNDDLELGAPRAALKEPGMLKLLGAPALPELPTTHSPWMLLRDALRGRLPDYVHLYFHDTDLMRPRGRAAVGAALRVLAARRPPGDPYGLIASLGAPAPPRTPRAAPLGLRFPRGAR